MIQLYRIPYKRKNSIDNNCWVQLQNLWDCIHPTWLNPADLYLPHRKEWLSTDWLLLGEQDSSLCVSCYRWILSIDNQIPSGLLKNDKTLQLSVNPSLWREEQWESALYWLSRFNLSDLDTLRLLCWFDRKRQPVHQNWKADIPDALKCRCSLWCSFSFWSSSIWWQRPKDS